MSRPSRLEAEPNVTPMIDVLLVLLIVFMFMVPMLQYELQVQLPEPVPGTARPDAPPLVLHIAPGPAYALNRQPIAPHALRATIGATFATRPTKVLFVAGDSGVSYQQVVTAMDVAKGAGVRVLAIAPRRATP